MDASLSFTVTDLDTAASLGSGSLPVLATPRLLAWCEAATCAALAPELDEATTSVGTRVILEHLSAAPIGRTVEVSTSRVFQDGRLHRFTVAALVQGRIVATGEVTRVAVDRQRFMDRLDT